MAHRDRGLKQQVLEALVPHGYVRTMAAPHPPPAPSCCSYLLPSFAARLASRRATWLGTAADPKESSWVFSQEIELGGKGDWTNIHADSTNEFIFAANTNEPELVVLRVQVCWNFHFYSGLPRPDSHAPTTQAVGSKSFFVFLTKWNVQFPILSFAPSKHTDHDADPEYNFDLTVFCVQTAAIQKYQIQVRCFPRDGSYLQDRQLAALW